MSGTELHVNDFRTELCVPWRLVHRRSFLYRTTRQSTKQQSSSPSQQTPRAPPGGKSKMQHGVQLRQNPHHFLRRVPKDAPEATAIVVRSISLLTFLTLHIPRPNECSKAPYLPKIGDLIAPKCPHASTSQHLRQLLAVPLPKRDAYRLNAIEYGRKHPLHLGSSNPKPELKFCNAKKHPKHKGTTPNTYSQAHR